MSKNIVYSLSIDWYEKYMNQPTFVYSIPVIPVGELHNNAQYCSFGEDGHRLLMSPYKDRCKYQSVCVDLTGNTNYAFGPFKSGWRCSVSAINKAFNSQYVNAGHGYGLQVEVALEQIARQFNGYVFVWKEETPTGVSYELMPWDFRMAKHMPLSPAHCDLRLLHTKDAEFFDLAMEELIY